MLPKMCSLELGKKSETKNQKKTFEHHISPLYRGGPAGPSYTIFGVWGHTVDVIIHIKFHVCLLYTSDAADE